MIDAEPTRSFVELYVALISQIIELERDAATVRFRNSEAHRAKHARQVSRVKRAGHSLVDDAAIDHVLERPQPRHVGFCFLYRRVELFPLLPHRRFLARDGDVVWSKPVHQLVTEDVRKERVK